MRPLAKRTFTRAVAWASAILILTGLSVIGLNSSAIPERAGKMVAGALGRSTGWQMSMDRVEFVAPTRLLLSDVEVSVPPDARGSDWVRSVKSPSVYVSVNPLQFILGNGGDEPTGKMTWMEPQIHLAKPLRDAWPALPGEGSGERLSTGTSSRGERAEEASGGFSMGVEFADGRLIDPTGTWLVHGALAVASGGAGTDVVVEKINLIHPDGYAQIDARVDGRGDERQWRWRAEGPAALFSSLLAVTDWELTGAVTASGTLYVDPPHSGSIELHVASGDVRWGKKTPDESVAFDTVTLVGELGTDIHIKELKMVQETGVIRGSGRIAMAGGPSTGPMIELDVHTRGLELPTAIPFLTRYGISGDADFSGVLAGSPQDLELSGRLKITSGTVWHRPVDRGEGVILLGSGRFTFGQTVLERDTARYRLKGEWRREEHAAQLRIELDSERGRAEEILAALGQSTAGVEGEVDGHFLLAGPIGDVRVSGSVDARELTLRNQPLDAVKGAFAWNGARLTLSNVVASHMGGTAAVSGEVQGDALGFEVALQRWPLDLEALPAGASTRENLDGWISYEGTLGGTWDAPTATGQITDGDVAVGRWHLTKPNGAIALNPERVSLDGVQVQALGGGEYSLSGTVDGWIRSDPTLNMDVEVNGASLSTLLSENGLSLPALLIDGEVEGTVAVTGSAARPNAQFDLALRDELELGSPLRLRFQYVDGRLKFGGLPGLFGIKGVS